jgi:mevalonate kinase
MKQKFYSNGKLLLTGEYVVLDGAKALAVPTIFGQDMVVDNGKPGEIAWKSFEQDATVWFEDVITFAEIELNDQRQSPSIKSTLIEILHAAFLQNPEFTRRNEGFKIETHLTFPRFWGLGTSSTLNNKRARWLVIFVFVLLKNCGGGCGFDLGFPKNTAPIIYRLEGGSSIVEIAEFNPPFSSSLYFVYLNRKQSSKAAIASYYMNREEHLGKKIAAIDRITEIIAHSTNEQTFAITMVNHESIISDIVEMKTVKEAFFKDFDGTIKSLGGWGGDFVLAISKDDPTEYFKDRGFMTVIRYDEMVLK